MQQKQFTVAILGAGSRGADIYGRLLMDLPEKFKIVSLCDPRPHRVKTFGEEFVVAEQERFTDENKFFAKKRADVLIIASMDNDHARQCLKGFELGYDILMEKPITEHREECEAVLAAQKKYGGKAFVCHVLRYAPAFVKAAELLESGAIGKLVAINALEGVPYWHYPHSYVRGNWRNRKVSAPAILAKCCHDLDLLQYYAKSKCKTVSSVGDLAYFTPENAPKNSAARCLDCQYVDTCPYSAKRLYIERWYAQGCPTDIWPYNVINTAPTTEEKIYEAMRNGPFGRCAFRCDNDVVDHQIVEMNFENGVKATLTMMAFTKEVGRRMTFYGTLGEVILDEVEGFVQLRIFGGENVTYQIKDLAAEGVSGYGHGGGDFYLINELYDILTGKGKASTSLEASIESHLMGICAEESRLKGGELIYVHK